MMNIEYRNCYIRRAKFKLIRILFIFYAFTFLVVNTSAQSIQYYKEKTLAYEVEGQLKKIYETIGLKQELPKAMEILDLLIGSWANIPTGIKWINNLGGDFSPPVEFSLAFKAGREIPYLRVLVEPQNPPFTLQSSWKSGLVLKEKIKNLPGVDISKFDKIHHIFMPPTDIQIPTTYETFSIWYAADIGYNHSQFKVYLNPRIHGGERAPEIVSKTLAILGTETAWDFISTRLKGNDGMSEIAFFSLDLVASAEARTKIYIAYQLITDIERQLQGCRYYINGTASDWINKLINKKKLFDVKPILITFNFSTKNNLPVPTVHIPIGAYVENDEITIQRLNTLLSPNKIKLLKTLISQISGKPLKSGNFINEIGIRPSENGLLDITFYLTNPIYESRAITNMP